MTPESTPAAPAWRVVSQATGAEFDASGNAVAGVKITYRLASGFTRTVFVPEDSYTLDKALAVIAADAATATAIDNLTAEG